MARQLRKPVGFRAAFFGTLLGNEAIENAARLRLALDYVRSVEREFRVPGKLDKYVILAELGRIRRLLRWGDRDGNAAALLRERREAWAELERKGKKR